MFSSSAASTLLSFASEGFKWYKDKRDFLEGIKESDEIKAVIALHKEYLAKITIHKEESSDAVSDSTAQESIKNFLPPIFVKAEEEAKAEPTSKHFFHPYFSSETVLEGINISELSASKEDNPDLREYKEAISDAIKKLFSFYMERIKPSCIKNFLSGYDRSAYIASDTESTVYCYLLYFLSKNFINFSGGKTDITCLSQLESFVRKYIELHKGKSELVKHLTAVCLHLKSAIIHLKKHNILLEFESRVKHLLNCSACAAEKMLISLAVLLKLGHDGIVTLSELAEEKLVGQKKIFSTESLLSEAITQCAKYYKNLSKSPADVNFNTISDKKISDIFGKNQNFLTDLPEQKKFGKITDILSHFFSVISMLISIRNIAQRLWNDRTQFVMHYEENFPHLFSVFQILEKLNNDLSERKMALLLAFREMDAIYMRHGLIPPGDFGKDAEEMLRYTESNVIESLNSIINKYRFYPNGKLVTTATAQAKTLVEFANQIALMHHMKIDLPEKAEMLFPSYSPRQFKSASANSERLSNQQIEERSGLLYV